ncbi:MAG: (d)CMP kinase [Gemmataceae bacterium]
MAAITAAVAGYRFDLHADRVWINDIELTKHVYTEAMGRAASRVGTFPEVRAKLKAEQRRIADDRDVVCEGRDQGTAVFPHAPVKFFFTASAETRATRRADQEGLPAEAVPELVAQISARDRQDEQRAIDPLRRADGAVLIDTSHCPGRGRRPDAGGGRPMPLPGVVDSAAYNGLYWTAFYGFTFGWGLRAVGRDNLPRTGPALLLSNHQSFLDPFMIGVAARRRIAYLARSNLWDNRIIGLTMTQFGAVPIDRGFGRDGLASVAAGLDRGRAVLMFPEGERTRTGQLQPLKAGVSLLFKRVSCPIVPVGVAARIKRGRGTALLPAGPARAAARWPVAGRRVRAAG